ncbi:hypothetical protein [Streptomyces roseus]|uniref:hypothetical protein n=1 Tax=Streptomyces roseus TaxID=66430 RepID=UPI000A943E8F|nr:hypothetical protein [Streptomyces roseus]
MRPAVQGPRRADPGGAHPTGAGHGEHLRVPGAARARFASRAGDRAARHAARPGSARFGQVAGLTDSGHPARRLIEEHKVGQRRRLTAMCGRAGAQAPDDVSAEITFLLEGAQVSAQNRSVDRAGDRLVARVTAAPDRGTAARKRSR